MPPSLLIIISHRNRVLQIPSRLSAVIYYEFGNCLALQGAGKCRFPDRPGGTHQTPNTATTLGFSVHHFFGFLSARRWDYIKNRTPREQHFEGDVVGLLAKKCGGVSDAKGNFLPNRSNRCCGYRRRIYSTWWIRWCWLMRFAWVNELLCEIWYCGELFFVTAQHGNEHRSVF